MMNDNEKSETNLIREHVKSKLSIKFQTVSNDRFKLLNLSTVRFDRIKIEIFLVLPLGKFSVCSFSLEINVTFVLVYLIHAITKVKGSGASLLNSSLKLGLCCVTKLSCLHGMYEEIRPETEKKKVFQE